MSRKKKVDSKHLFHAICNLNVIPVFSKPVDDAIMVSQMLFGETCHIVEKKNKHWFKIQCIANDLKGWINSLHIQLIDEATFKTYNENH